MDRKQAQRRYARLMVVDSCIGVLDPDFAVGLPLATPLAASALTFARDVAWRWSTQRGGEPSVQVFAANQLAVALGLAFEEVSVTTNQQLSAAERSPEEHRPPSPPRTPDASWLPRESAVDRTPAQRAALPFGLRRAAADHPPPIAGEPSADEARWLDAAGVSRSAAADTERLRLLEHKVERVFNRSETISTVERLRETALIEGRHRAEPLQHPPAPPAPALAAPGVDALTRDVMGAIERRLTSMRERTGRF